MLPRAMASKKTAPAKRKADEAQAAAKAPANEKVAGARANLGVSNAPVAAAAPPPSPRAPDAVCQHASGRRLPACPPADELLPPRRGFVMEPRPLTDDSDHLPDSHPIPILPLRDVVVYPHMVIPLFVGREKSIAALDAAMQTDKRILLVDGGIIHPLIPRPLLRRQSLRTVVGTQQPPAMESGLEDSVWIFLRTILYAMRTDSPVTLRIRKSCASTCC